MSGAAMSESKASEHATEAAALVRDGDHVVVSGCGAAPLLFLSALAERRNLSAVTVHHATAWGDLPHLRADAPPHLIFEPYFLSANSRRLVRDGAADYLPVTFSHMGEMLGRGQLKADVVAVTATRPDARGDVSLGPFVSYLPAALSTARVRIVETSSAFPWVNGSGVVALERFDVAIECDRAPVTIASTKDHREAHTIAEYVANLVPDGATIQIGRGALPNAIAERLQQRRNLGIHSEMVSDWLVGLVECGAIRRMAKPSGRPPVVTSFMDGTPRLYDFVDGRTDIEMDPIYELNRVENIAREPNFVAINSALQVDLTGQINAETAGGAIVAGSGGLLDFAMGAAFSQGGRFIVAMPSTAMDGRKSRIVARLAEGEAVTVPRSLAQYVITEFGVADLSGCTLRERARRLVAITHPDFRDELCSHE